MPVEFGDYRKAGQSAKDELEQHTATARVEIGKCYRRRYQTEEQNNENKIPKSAHVLLPPYVTRFLYVFHGHVTCACHN